MIDHTTEQLITPGEAAKLLPSGVPGRRVHVSTVHRWIAAKELDSLRIGGRRFTSVEAVGRFIAYSNRRSVEVPQTAAIHPSPTASARRAMSSSYLRMSN
jgi:excisionase family DNA binding protein